MGELVEKNLHSENGGSTHLQSVDYRYNIRGWLSSINNHNLNSDGGVTNDDTNDLFGMMLRYNAGLGTGAGTAQYNGNIGEITWREKQSNKLQGYGFSYDAMNRLKTANYRHYNGSNWTASAENNRYNENIPSYDKNGNIQTLNRNSELGQIDNLSYTYEGNRLIRVHDTANASQGFINGSTSTTATEYTYDANGNMKTDLNKGISQINYNYLNLPQTVNINGATVNYTYDAQGQKLKKTAGITTTDYIGGIHYENNSVTFMQTAEGRLRKDGTAWVYEYNLTDHLGNVRVSFDKNPSTGLARLIQKDDYYPFGMTFSHPTVGENKYLYNSKELQQEMDWYDYGARMYMPEIARFGVIDRFGEKYMDLTPYQYGGNNPIVYIDINGDSLMVRGSQSSIDNFKDLANQGLGNGATINVDNSGNVSLTRNKGKMTKQQRNFYKDLNKVVNSKGKTSIGLVERGGDVEIGSFYKELIDVEDMRSLGNSDLTKNEATSAQGALIHEIREQYEKQVKGVTDVYSAHATATKAENRTNGSIRIEREATSVQDQSGNNIGASLNSTVKIGNKSSNVNIVIINGNVNQVLINGVRKKN